uniref:Uncharacterized protein n=1 Tax=Manihot esculenta TaxID=3983 RepID=A0A2C9UDJ9_MANES
MVGDTSKSLMTSIFPLVADCCEFNKLGNQFVFLNVFAGFFLCLLLAILDMVVGFDVVSCLGFLDVQLPFMLLPSRFQLLQTRN